MQSKLSCFHPVAAGFTDAAENYFVALYREASGDSMVRFERAAWKIVHVLTTPTIKVVMMVKTSSLKHGSRISILNAYQPALIDQ